MSIVLYTEDRGSKLVRNASNLHQSTRSHVPENFNLHQYLCENLNSRINIFISHTLSLYKFLKKSTKWKAGHN